MAGSHEIDPSELQRVQSVGSGGTAEVFKSLYRGQYVAVKVIDWHKSGLREHVAFEREVAILSSVDHVNLVKFLGITSEGRPLRIVTEFCFGGSVYNLLHDMDHVELSLRQNLVMATQVASAMHYLHMFEPQIIHRDLKSLNLLLMKEIQGPTDQPTIKVADFGLSRVRMVTQDGDDAGWGKLTIAAGTCCWMAPEVFQSHIYDQRADVYSYAMILFEILCREIPFIDEDLHNVCRLAVEGQRPDLEAVPPDCPRDLRKLMISCWNHAPEERPQFSAILRILDGV